MRRTARPSIVGVALLAALLVAVVAGACSSDDGGSGTTTTTGSQAFSIETQDGQVSLSLDGALPPGWPSNFPTPSGVTPAGSGSVGDQSSSTLVGVYRSTGSAQDAYDAYRNDPALTITSSSQLGSGGNFIGSLELGGAYDGRITVGGVAGQTLIVVLLKGQSGSTTTAAGSSSTGATSSVVPGGVVPGSEAPTTVPATSAPTTRAY